MAQKLANELGVPVRAPTEAVSVMPRTGEVVAIVEDSDENGRPTMEIQDEDFWAVSNRKGMSDEC